jgi:fatty-acyl-CoA synthase
VAAYVDYLRTPTDLPVPEFVRAPRRELSSPTVTAWSDALAMGLTPGPMTAGPDDLCVMPYTSGTTGEPKGCMHTHRSTMHTLVGSMQWFDTQPELTLLALVPFFHVTGMQGAMNGPIYIGTTIVLLPRWDREVAAECVQRYRISGWTGVPTLVQDFFANPNLERYDLSSVRRLSGGGAAMPAAIAERLKSKGITYCEGYGLSETCAATHINPPNRAKSQCLGIPIYAVDSRVVDPVTLVELPPGEVGEIVTHGPQLMQGYWNKPEQTAESFSEDGWFKTGDIGVIDADGYLSITDRKKELIKTSNGKFIAPQPIEGSLKGDLLVGQAALVGDKQKYVSALISPNFAALAEWAKRQGIESDVATPEGRSALVQQPQVKAAYKEIVDRVNAKLAPYEVIKKHCIVPDEWSLETGELTPSLKLKRRVIQQNYAAQIAGFYGD